MPICVIAWHLDHLATGPLAVAPACTPRLFEHLKTKRLKKRVVQKPDGRYLIYYRRARAGAPSGDYRRGDPK